MPISVTDIVYMDLNTSLPSWNVFYPIKVHMHVDKIGLQDHRQFISYKLYQGTREGQEE